jgi:hypothetical protein
MDQPIDIFRGANDRDARVTFPNQEQREIANEDVHEKIPLVYGFQCISSLKRLLKNSGTQVWSCCGVRPNATATYIRCRRTS